VNVITLATALAVVNKEPVFVGTLFIANEAVKAYDAEIALLAIDAVVLLRAYDAEVALSALEAVISKLLVIGIPKPVCNSLPLI
jgi:hypothetical protein